MNVQNCIVQGNAFFVSITTEGGDNVLNFVYLCIIYNGAWYNIIFLCSSISNTKVHGTKLGYLHLCIICNAIKSWLYHPIKFVSNITQFFVSCWKGYVFVSNITFAILSLQSMSYITSSFIKVRFNLQHEFCKWFDVVHRVWRCELF